jgi:hypothetical protein
MSLFLRGSMETLTDEQQKRIALLEAFEAKTAPEREVRNAGIDQHEQEYREKWLQLQSSLEATRGDLQTRLKGLGASDQSISASVAIELAKLTEGYYAEKDKAARTGWHAGQATKLARFPERVKA